MFIRRGLLYVSMVCPAERGLNEDPLKVSLKLLWWLLDQKFWTNSLKSARPEHCTNIIKLVNNSKTLHCN